MKNVYNFPDFESAISSKGLSAALNEGDNGVGQGKAPGGKSLLAHVKSVGFPKESPKMF